jgi:hypothetical protein
LHVFLKRQNSNSLQEGSTLSRDNPKLPLTPSATIWGSTPWRERAFLQLKTASEIAGVSVTTLYRFSDAGRLKLREFGGRTLVDTPSFIALLATADDWKPKNRGHQARAKRSEIARAALQG